MEPKTIQYQRTRKVNPGMIDSKFDWGSETIEYGAWGDISADEDKDEAVKQLTSHVDGVVQERIEALVFSLRSKARKRNYYWDAIEKAFFALMSTQNMPEEEMKIALERFQEFLEQEMKGLEV